MIDITNCACKGCILSKQLRDNFLVGKSKRAKQPLELVHTNMCDPVEIRSLGYKKYILTFIGDFTKKNLDLSN